MSLEFRGKPAGRCSQARTDLVCFAAKPTPHLKERQSPLPAGPPNPCYWGAKQTCIIFGTFPGRKSKIGFLSTRLLGVPFGPQGAMPDPAPHRGVPGTKELKNDKKVYRGQTPVATWGRAGQVGAWVGNYPGPMGAAVDQQLGSGWALGSKGLFWSSGFWGSGLWLVPSAQTSLHF